MRYRPLLRLVGSQAPTVDVFITYCGEGVGLVMNTIRAAVFLDYPPEQYRVIVLDDSGSTELERRVISLQSQKAGLHYTSRKSQIETHSKAANLNHGLRYVDRLPGGPSEHLAVLDVDMIPLPHWLRAVVPHLINDPKVGLANPPQEFYNLLDGDPLLQSLAASYDVVEVLKDCSGLATCTGTGFVARRQAINDLGGIPTECINEDFLTSIYLDATGWKIVYVPETLQIGIVPDTWTKHVTQHGRWCAGLSSVPFIINNHKVPSLTVKQRSGAMMPALLTGLPVTIGIINLLIFPFLLSTGKSLVIYSDISQIHNLLLLLLLQVSISWFFGYFESAATEFRIPIYNPAPWVCLLPFQAAAMMKMTWAYIRGRATPKFSPSGCATESHSSGSTSIVASIAFRTKDVLWTNGGLFYVYILISVFVGLYLSLKSAFLVPSGSPDDRHLGEALLSRAAWPSAFRFWQTYIGGGWTPVAYALFPPKRLSPEALLTKNPINGVFYPSKEAMDPRRLKSSQHHSILVVAYIWAAFGLSWYL